ncbi:MAG: tetratricopeptide repeat protein [bacterium]
MHTNRSIALLFFVKIMAKKKKKNRDTLTDRQKKIIRQRYQKDEVADIAKSLSLDPSAVSSYIAEINPQLTKGKRLFFWLLLLSLPVLLLTMTEVVLRLVNYSGNHALFVAADFDPKYMMINRNVGTRYFVSKAVNPAVSYNVFLKKKPANSYRIFVLGGSSAAGYPYLYNGAFSQMLLPRLTNAFPGKKIEMVNMAMPAVNSYTLLDLADEIMPWQADALLIYAGHNEFYGALGIGSSESVGRFRSLVNYFLKLQDYKTFLLLKNVVQWFAGSSGAPDADDVAASRTLMERMVQDQEIGYRGEKYQLALNNFIANLHDIIAIAQQNNVKILLSDLVSNVREQKPFVSIFVEEADKTLWQEMFDQAASLQAGQKYADALEMYQRAASIDSLPAILHFRIAQCLERAGEYESAKQSYERAKDQDGLRFRASEDFSEAIVQLGKETNSPVARMREAFESHSPNGLIGANLMLDHLHPNLEGYFLMARTFVEAMREHHFIGTEWQDSSAKPDSVYWQETGVTVLDHKVAEIRVEILMAGWPFQPQNAPNPASRFEPQNFFEKTALDFWEKDVTWERAHVQMAEYYSRQGKLDSAALEYKALIHYMPINISSYLFLARIYLQQQNFAKLREVLLPSLEIEETALARKWIGILALKDGDANNAVAHLEKALTLDPKDLQSMYNLCGAYALSGMREKAEELTKKLLQRAPNYPGARDLLRQLKS